jgi:hypothetical protein
MQYRVTGSEKKSGMVTVSGTTTGTPSVASRPKAGSPGDGVGDGDDTASREATKAPREAASMV